MTIYTLSDENRIRARKVHGKFKSGSWTPVDKADDGTLVIRDENGDRRVLSPVDG